ncbi:TPR-like domain-containing protein [Catenovulum agarivorans DS-2]|uniref:Ancillary SecYEG translocon subunit n=1 Tax=Catenovulum agarivorans DS-2 TaxID=1328313 RepID=W7R3Z7_9ALTE|nr:tetratricopeptide repeat protein [Catenovulum agarivorans]EWH12350.1 TPR-like domain-containing protein [Catenovulum agarivorans DS-2]
MEIFSTEEQQEEAIKNFLSKYSNAIIGGFVAGLVGIYGYNWYQDKTIADQEAMSQEFTQIESETGLNKEQAAEFVVQNSESGFAVLASFKLAKAFVEEQAFDKAAEQLKWVINNSEDASVVDLATVRLARVQIALGQSEQAYTLLSAPKTEAFVAQFAELKGDIDYKAGRIDQAREQYQLAADNDGLTGNPGLKMKLDNLATDNGTVAL